MRNIVMRIQLVLAVTCVDEESIAKKEPISKEASITRKKKRKHGVLVLSSKSCEPHWRRERERSIKAHLFRQKRRRIRFCRFYPKLEKLGFVMASVCMSRGILYV
ncbi:hypothetical protein YC2023_122793 [Brassica napus]